MLTVVRHERASSPSAWVVSADTSKDSTPLRPNTIRPGGPTSVGVSKPSKTLPQADRAASLSCPESQVTNLR
ncbi:Uncharacterised protein [Mycobacteroides abscessus subsp. abscessus]|nr:Uncharacterised protein [Mycobacteroides abscessus subsp. abscessus]